MLPCLPIARRTERARDADPRRRSRSLFAATAASLVQWQQGHVKGAIAAGVAVLAGFAAIQLAARARPLRRPARRSPGSPGSAALLALGRARRRLVGAAPLPRAPLREPQPAAADLADAVRWARDLRDATVAVGGIRGVFNQYPFYGTDLSNQVQWLGRRRARRRLRADPDLRRVAPGARRRRLHPRGHHLRPVRPRHAHRHQGGAVDARRTRRAKQILRDGPVSVFELAAPPDPAACGDLPDLSRGGAQRRLGQRRPDREPALSRSRCSRSTPARSLICGASRGLRPRDPASCSAARRPPWLSAVDRVRGAGGRRAAAAAAARPRDDRRDRPRRCC